MNQIKKIGVLGSGVVGQTLASAFLSEGYEVMLSSRDGQKAVLKEWQADRQGAHTGSFAEAAAFGDLLVLSTLGSAAEEALAMTGAEAIAGKVVIDTTNPIDMTYMPPQDGVLRFFTGPNDSLLERLQDRFPQALMVKAFSSVGSALMYKPQLAGGKPSMFICGNDASARKAVGVILQDFGWEVEDMGVAVAARAIEPLCMLWCIGGFTQNDWVHAFKMLRP